MYGGTTFAAGTLIPSWFGLQGIGSDDNSDDESGIGIVNSVPERFPIEQFKFEITESYIDALRDGKFIEIRVGSMGTNEYQVYLSLAPKKD